MEEKINKVETLVATMLLKNEEEVNKLIQRNKVKIPYLIINQMPNAKEEEKWDSDRKEARVRTYLEKGVSKSRNHAIDLIMYPIGLIADDDVTYVENYQDMIQKAYQAYPQADIIAFRVDGLRKNKNRKPLKTGKINNYFMTMKIASVQITFKKESIQKQHLKFDIDFGTGSNYNRGEETVFLCDCLRKGLKIQYINQTIGKVEEENSSWFKRL